MKRKSIVYCDTRKMTFKNIIKQNSHGTDNLSKSACARAFSHPDGQPGDGNIYILWVSWDFILFMFWGVFCVKTPATKVTPEENQTSSQGIVQPLNSAD